MVHFKERHNCKLKHGKRGATSVAFKFRPEMVYELQVPVLSAGSDQHSESEHGMVYLPHSFATSHDFSYFALHLFNAKSSISTQTTSLREKTTPEYYAEGTYIISFNRCECMY